MNSVPIIFYQGGPYCSYLKLSVKQAFLRNPNSQIVLLADSPDQYRADLPITPQIKFVPIKDYYTSAQKFEEVYAHLSTNPEHFELPCFTRWFVIDEYCKRHFINKYFYLDNDVLLYCNLQNWLWHFESFAYTVSNNIAWSSVLMKDTRWLTRFCEFCMNVYTLQGDYGRLYYSRLLSHFSDLQSAGRLGGVCDMTLISHFRQDAFTPPGLVGEMSTILKVEEGRYFPPRFLYYTFDHNINQSDGFEMLTNPNIKKMIWTDKNKGMPVCFNKELNIDVRFLALHFQGAAKGLMESCCDEG
jgi:hypothetical protein